MIFYNQFRALWHEALAEAGLFELPPGPRPATRDLSYHPHVHYLVPGGGLAPDGQVWLPSRQDFLVHLKTLLGLCIALALLVAFASQHAAQQVVRLCKKSFDVKHERGL
jgi:hypothetical protein